ncbi:Nif3-like dinuclear metal center hexameric protein [Algibacillus agarilyticus]|uniref:Nif3-like dinuclear metal center hexameric protein n=1 Tax=Algibacillus agarilyticus TaxID=2234133 RepID=UPI000DD07825|nr:Nif3-like dinuclear metal center hexameric protein [Algibacillus agarilyticus]
MNNYKLETYLNTLLSAKKIKDYCPNGLQIEGKTEVKKIITGVTASMELIEKAIDYKADALLVHHGYFWKGENEKVIGMKRNRFKALLSHDINLYAYHLPLDVHPTLGNNAQLAQLLNLDIIDGLSAGDPLSIGNIATTKAPISAADFAKLVSDKLNRQVLLEAAGPEYVNRIGLCTGGAQDYIEQAHARDADLYITGEVSERTIHSARELGIHFISAGHHATERYGAKALGEYLITELGLDVTFVDIDNPA